MSNWRERGACLSLDDPDLWFPNGVNQDAEAQAAEAKRVCADCVVMSECRGWALRTGQRFGVWGGLDERELASLRRRASPVSARGSV